MITLEERVSVETLAAQRVLNVPGAALDEVVRVRHLMSKPVHTCRLDTDLAAVTKLMWEHDCGFVPVVDASGKSVGALTDRDICIATAALGLLPEHISAAQSMASPVHGCLLDDSVTDVLATMKQFRVKQLPVIDSNGRPQGVISMNDIVLVAAFSGDLAAMKVVSSMAFISVWKRRLRDFRGQRSSSLSNRYMQVQTTG